MIGESVHHNREGEYVAAHDENKEDDLSEAKDLATDGTKDYLPSIGLARLLALNGRHSKGDVPCYAL